VGVSAHRPEHLELAAGWVLDVLDETERQAFEAHLATCVICTGEVARLTEGARVLAASSAPAVPAATLRPRVLAHVRAEMAKETAKAPAARVTPMPERRAAPWLAWGLATAAAVMAVFSVSLWQTEQRLRRELSTLESTRADLARQLEEERQWMALLDSPQAKVVDFAPTPQGAQLPHVRATWDPASRRAVLVFDQLAAPAGQDFELWGIHPSGPKSLGLVRADASGRAVVRLADVGDSATLQAFAISLEREGGSGDPNAPVGPVVLVANLR
jgi:anti-sigma-K factor RskA